MVSLESIGNSNVPLVEQIVFQADRVAFMTLEPKFHEWMRRDNE
jgi:hypothetical protein